MSVLQNMLHLLINRVLGYKSHFNSSREILVVEVASLRHLEVKSVIGRIDNAIY